VLIDPQDECGLFLFVAHQQCGLVTLASEIRDLLALVIVECQHGVAGVLDDPIGGLAVVGQQEGDRFLSDDPLLLVLRVCRLNGLPAQHAERRHDQHRHGGS
jgi:hypothetical protein